MIEKINKFLDRFGSLISILQWLWPVFGLLTIGGVSTVIASISGWLDGYGPIVWFFAALLAMLVASLIASLVSVAREHWIMASASRQWKNEVHGINPLDSDFRNTRININDLAHPIKRTIEGKKIHGCEIIGPANIILLGGNKRPTLLANNIFFGCNVFAIKDNTCIPVRDTFIVIKDTDIIDCEIARCNVFVTERIASEFEKSGIKLLRLG